MKQITLTLNVSPAAAVRAGRSSCGDHQVVLSDAELAALTDDQRDTLARHVAGEKCESGVCDWSAPLTEHAEPISEATVAVVSALLTHRREHIEARRAELAAESARDVVRAKASRESVLFYARTCPIAELDYDGRDRTMHSLHSEQRDGRWPGLYSNDCNERNASVAALVGRQGELASYREELAAAKEAEAAQKAEEKAAVAAKIAAWVTEHADVLPANIVRAQAEGRDTSRALNGWLGDKLKDVDQQIASLFGGYVVETYDHKPYVGVPSDAAYALLDAIKSNLGRYAEATMGESVPDGEPQIVIADVQRVGDAVWRSAVRVTFKSTLGLGDCDSVILAQPPPEPRQDDDDSE